MAKRFNVSLECDVERVQQVAKDEFDETLTNEQAEEVIDNMEEPDADEAFDEFISQQISNWLDAGGTIDDGEDD